MAGHAKLGTYWKKKRIERGLSQHQVAEKFGYSTSQFVSNWERSLCSPPDHSLPILAELYKIPREEIMEALIQQRRAELKTLLSKNSKRRSK